MTNKVKAGIYTALVVLGIAGLFLLTLSHPESAMHVVLYITCGILMSGIIAVIYMMMMDLIFNEEVPCTEEIIPSIRKEDVAPPPRTTPDINNQQTMDELLIKFKQAVQDNTRLTIENERLRQKKSAM